jgi:biopolymer transport protein ExbD
VLTAQRANDAGINLLLQADRDVPYGRVAQVMAAAQRAGITRLAFVTVPE